MGWGAIPWGGGRWGGAPAPLSIDLAYAVGLHEVLVRLTVEPRSVNGYTVGDAYCPRTWQVVRQDTLRAFSVLAVRRQSATEWVLRMLEPLASHFVTHRASSTTLLSAGGAAIVAPKFYDFPGVDAYDTFAPRAQAGARRYADRDIANPPLPRGTTSVAGTWQVTPEGDWAWEEGAALVRKLVLRRLFTPKGGFFHLPDYGVGLGVKEVVPFGEAEKLRSEIQRQVEREPEVERAQVEVSLSPARGVLTVGLRIRVRGLGQVMPMEVAVPVGVVL